MPPLQIEVPGFDAQLQLLPQLPADGGRERRQGLLAVGICVLLLVSEEGQTRRLRMLIHRNALSRVSSWGQMHFILTVIPPGGLPVEG